MDRDAEPEKLVDDNVGKECNAHRDVEARYRIIASATWFQQRNRESGCRESSGTSLMLDFASDPVGGRPV